MKSNCEECKYSEDTYITDTSGVQGHEICAASVCVTCYKSSSEDKLCSNFKEKCGYCQQNRYTKIEIEHDGAEKDAVYKYQTFENSDYHAINIKCGDGVYIEIDIKANYCHICGRNLKG